MISNAKKQSEMKKTLSQSLLTHTFSENRYDVKAVEALRYYLYDAVTNIHDAVAA